MRVVLHLALDLSEKKWKLAFTTGLGQRPRMREVRGGDVGRVVEEVARAKRRFGLPEDARVVSCYEAGMEGFWLHRALGALGIENYVVESSSIDTKRRRRRAKTDRLDAGALLDKLVQFIAGHGRIWSVVHVPPEAEEDVRHNERELRRLRDEQTALRNGIKGLLKTQGVRLQRMARDFAKQISEIRTWNGEPLRRELQSRLVRMYERMQLIRQQMGQVEGRREALLQEESGAAVKARRLLELRGLGVNLSWTLGTELFGWRDFRNRRQVAGVLGLGPIPAQSGDLERTLGISKAGSTRVRASVIEMAWLWVRYQPTSALTRWFDAKYAGGGKRLRRIGIVALARRLAIALWKYVELGALPEGAVTKA